MATNLQVIKGLKSALLSNSGRLASRCLTNQPCAIYNGSAESLHLSTKQNYPQVEPLPMPMNIDPTETTRFSPQRSRDISSGAILSHQQQYHGATLSFNQQIDITVDNTAIVDPHVPSYDCTGAVSLNSSMQSNVPCPFGGLNKFTHLNMPGGQWEQGNKFMSHDLQAIHYINLRRSVRENWSKYDDEKGTNRTNASFVSILPSHANVNAIFKRLMSTKAPQNDNSNKSDSPISSQTDDEKSTDIKELTLKEKLTKAMKEYGSTVIVFHVGISLISLGSFYLLVSSGLDVVAILNHFGWGESVLTTKLASGASTFVVAYAVHKVFAPVRISITLAATPFIVRYLRQKGFLKPTIKNKK